MCVRGLGGWWWDFPFLFFFSSFFCLDEEGESSRETYSYPSSSNPQPREGASVGTSSSLPFLLHLPSLPLTSLKRTKGGREREKGTQKDVVVAVFMVFKHVQNAGPSRQRPQTQVFHLLLDDSPPFPAERTRHPPPDCDLDGA